MLIIIIIIIEQFNQYLRKKKYDIIKQIESQGNKQQQVSDETGILRGTIARWCSQDKDKITKAYESDGSNR